ncbi:MAG: hypothetical protein ABI488_18930 [Polyangiaceae bacterium]
MPAPKSGNRCFVRIERPELSARRTNSGVSAAENTVSNAKLLRSPPRKPNVDHALLA